MFRTGREHGHKNPPTPLSDETVIGLSTSRQGLLHRRFSMNISSLSRRVNRVAFCTPSATELCFDSGSKSKLLYNWRFTANLFILGPFPLRFMAGVFMRPNLCGRSPYDTPCLQTKRFCLSWINSVFVNCKYQSYKKLFKKCPFCNVYNFSLYPGL